MKLESDIIDAIAAIAAVLVQSDSLSSMLRRCCELLVEHLDAALTRIWLYEYETNSLILHASGGCYGGEISDQYKQIPVGDDYKIGRIAKNKAAEFTNDVSADPILNKNNFLRSENIQSFAGHPMVVGDQLHGVVAVFARSQLTNADLKMFQAVSDMIATAVERRISEEKLQESRKEVEAFFENPVLALHSVDATGHIRHANRTELRMLGYSADEYVGKHLREIHLDPELADELCMRLSKNEVIRDFSARLLCKDGSHKDVLIDSDAVMQDGIFQYSRCFTRDVTESNVARELLDRARQLFRAVFDQTFNFIGVLSLEGILLDANETALAVIGRKLEDVLGRYFWETEWWSDRPELQERLKTAVRGASRGEIHRFEVEHRHSKTGQIIYVDFSLKPVTDHTGAVVLLIPEGRDITERKKAEREILESEARTRAIVETAPDGIMTIDQSGTIVSANKPMHMLFGYSDGELIGLNASALISSLLELKSAHPTVDTTFSSLRHETRGRKKDGELIPVEVSLSELELSDRKVFTAIVADISERLKSQSLQSRLAALVESCEDAIYGITIDGAITSWNPAAERLYGWTACEAIGNSLGIIFPPGRMHEFEQLVSLGTVGEKIQNFETVRMTRDGRLIDVALTISPVRDDMKNTTGLSIIARDISLKKAAEKRVSEFYSMVSHELRTPLTSIRASLGLLEGGIAGELPDDACQLVQIARSESDRLIRLINDILDLRKIEAGKVELRIETVQTKDLLKRVCDGLKAMADEASVKLTHKIDFDSEIRCDKDRIIQVLTNLCSNAIKYSPIKGLVTISVARSTNGFIRFCVTDKGPGIRPEYMHKLFGKFQQIDSSDARPKGGTGLGLAIVKAIVEQHAGRVGVDSLPGRGSTFWFEIPGGVDEQDATASGEVFIIEEDASLSKTLQKLLSSIGYKVRFAASLKAAEKQLRKAVPNVVLLEVHLPDGNGLDLMRKIWKQPAFANLPAIVLTGNSQEAQDAGPLLIDWMQKPFDKSRLTRALTRAMRRQIGNPLRVLLIEDDHATASIIKKLLASAAVECSWAPDGRTALTMVRNINPDLIVLDIGLPPPDGFDLVRILRQEGSGNIPLLVYTGRDLDNTEKEELKLGKTKHLIKSKVGQKEFVDAVRELLGSVPAAAE